MVVDLETADVETSSENYATRFAGPVGAWFLRVQEQAVLAMLAADPSASVLDVGGGHGQVTEGLMAQGHAVTVLGSSEACRRGVQRFLGNGHCRFETGDLLQLPYADRAFNVVISLRLLPHVQNWSRLLTELTRVARRAVIVDFPSSRSLNCLTPALFSMKRRLEGNTRPYTLFDEPELVGAFESLGFSRAGRYAEFLLPMVLHRRVSAAGISRATEGLLRHTGLTDRFGSPVILHMVRMSEAST